nr:MAG TPA: hypothetical protein [Caudoviricetes sp.]
MRNIRCRATAWHSRAYGSYSAELCGMHSPAAIMRRYNLHRKCADIAG